MGSNFDEGELKAIRNSRETETMLRQFLRVDGPKGATGAYKRGWDWNFLFTQDDRDSVARLVESGLDFEQAFEQVKASKK